MAAELRAELSLRDGQQRSVRVWTGTGTGTGTLALGSLISAVRELSQSVTCLLTELVQLEQVQGACATELDGEDEEDEDDPSDCEPEPKRTKP